MTGLAERNEKIEGEKKGIFLSSCIYTVAKFGVFLYGDFSKILTLKQYKEVIKEINIVNKRMEQKL